VTLLPYLAKAFTVDDVFFLRQAEHSISDPLHPAAFDFVWSDVSQRMSSSMPSGPVGAWLLVPTVATGAREWVGHLTTLLSLLIGIAATVSLAFRLELDWIEARMAGLYLATMPAVVAMAATVMPDVAAMALGVLGLERLMAWSSTRRARDGAAAAGALALASMARSHLIGLVVVGALFLVAGSPWSWRAWWRTPRARWWPLLAAAAMVAAMIWATRDRDGAGITASVRSLTSSDSVRTNLLAFFSHWTWSMSFGLGWCLLRWCALPGAAAEWLPVAVALGLLEYAGRGAVAALTIAMALAIAAIAGALIEGGRSRDGRRLGLAAWLLVPLPILPYVHLPPKYLVASAPGAALLLARATRLRDGRWARLAGICVGVAGLALGLLIVRADADLAGLERRAAHREIGPRVRAGKQVWFSGHWGFQWYAERAGAHPLVRNPRPAQPGDIVVVDEEAFSQELINDYPDRRLLNTLVDDRPGGRIMNRAANAGFYSNYWGDLPWNWSDTAALDRISVWEIERPK
jgi:hypothetical protein